MGGLVLLLVLSALMAVASFLAGSLPLAISLSPSQLRIISSLGIGILVGTSMIVIIPEGIEAVVSSGVEAHSHSRVTKRLAGEGLGRRGLVEARIATADEVPVLGDEDSNLDTYLETLGLGREVSVRRRDSGDGDHDGDHDDRNKEESDGDDEHDHEEGEGRGVSTFHIGLSMILGFVLMFLIDRIPRHATDQLRPEPQMRHVNLHNLGANLSYGGEEGEDEIFLGSLSSPGPGRSQSRSFATTIGLVIHACADGIAMGAGATTSDTQLGLIIFVAIMLHKAPAAFGLSSVLLKQGLSKRATRAHLVVFSLAAPFGALATWAIVAILGGGHFEGPSGKWWTGMLLLFSAGTFLYVAMHAMNEENGSGHDHHGRGNSHGHSETGTTSGDNGPQLRDTMITVVGMLLPLLTRFGHHH